MTLSQLQGDASGKWTEVIDGRLGERDQDWKAGGGYKSKVLYNESAGRIISGSQGMIYGTAKILSLIEALD